MTPHDTPPEQDCINTQGGIELLFRILFYPDTDLFSYAIQIRAEPIWYLIQTQVHLQFQSTDPWKTGLVDIPPNLLTASASFEAMA